MLAWVTVFAPAPTAAADAGPLSRAIESVRFVAYTPTDLSIVDGQVRAASPRQIRQDLRRLRADFQGLVTYSSGGGLEAVPAIAAELGFRAIVLGVWDPASTQELATAVRLARRWPRLVVAVAVGNETLLAGRHAWPVLRGAMQRVRDQLPGVAVATSEPFYYYLDGEPADFVAQQDFLLPSVHPLFQPWFAHASTSQAVEFVVNVVQRLEQVSTKPLLIKETGLPSGPAGSGFSGARQAEFWRLLCERLPSRPGLGLVYFEAFDHPWKTDNARHEFGDHPEEAYWGLYRHDGRPKPVMAQLRALWNQPARSGCRPFAVGTPDAGDGQ